MSKPHFATTSHGISLKRSRRSMLGHSDRSTSEPTIDQTSSTAGRSDQLSKKHVRCENTYKLEPDERFDKSKVERIAQGVLEEKLKDVRYDPTVCKCMSQQLAGEIMDKIKSLNLTRYKLVAVVSIGSLRERPGMQFGSRCLWNQQTDKFASVKFTNGSLFAVAMVYGLYFE